MSAFWKSVKIRSAQLTAANRRWLTLPVLALTAWLICPAIPARASETNPPAAPFLFHVGMAKICFRDVRPDDATAAYRILLERNAREFGTVIKADTAVFDDTPAFESALQHQTIHMAIFNSWQFLQMDIHQQMQPIFVVMQNGKVGRKYLVLTRRGSGFNTLAALRGKDIIQQDVASSGPGKVWLETRLLSEKLGTPATFFGSVESVAKPTTAVLPVFFGKKAACVVDEASFDVMTELNPQVGQQLQIVAMSDALANPVVCLRKDGWPSAREKSIALRTLGELHLNPTGQQICTLFKIDRMVPFEDSQLDSIRKLRATYESLRKERQP